MEVNNPVIFKSAEEMELLKADMSAIIQYWFDRSRCIIDKLKELDAPSESDKAVRGVICSLQHLKWEAELHLRRATLSFGTLIQIPDDIHLPDEHSHQVDELASEDFEDFSDSEVDSDSDQDHY